jgi:ABC-2 type transport system ATP-binding protein
MIKVEGLTKRYGYTTAVKNISFEVEKGEIVGFLGPNGAGKTTTMRILTGFLPPTEGAASIGGLDVQEQPIEVKRRIGYLPETPPLYPEMTVRDYLEFVGRLKGIAGSELAARVDSVIDRCSIGGVRGKLNSQLSKGYKQRVGLAQALIHNPDVLILDEPTAGLDPKQIIEVRELIGELSGEHTIILSTHILSEVSTTCGRVIIINNGKLEANDTPENLTSRLQGHDSVWVEVDGPADEVEAKIRGIQGVEKVSRATGQAGRAAWQVEIGKDPAVRTELARAVIESGWGLHEIRSIGLSLEDIFLKLTSEDPGADPEVDSEAEEAPGSPDLEAAAAPEEDSSEPAPPQDAPEAERRPDA